MGTFRFLIIFSICVMIPGCASGRHDNPVSPDSHTPNTSTRIAENTNRYIFGLWEFEIQADHESVVTIPVRTSNWHLNGDSSDHAVAVAPDASGNVYVTGFFAETVDLDPEPGEDWHTAEFTQIPRPDCFISKFNSSGGFSMDRNLGKRCLGQGT